MKLEPVVGFEPTTVRLQIGCSTTELNWLKATIHDPLHWYFFSCHTRLRDDSVTHSPVAMAGKPHKTEAQMVTTQCV